MGIIDYQSKKDELAEALEDPEVFDKVYKFEKKSILDDVEDQQPAGNEAQKRIVLHTVTLSNKFTLAFLKELYVKLGLGEKPPK